MAARKFPNTKGSFKKSGGFAAAKSCRATFDVNGVDLWGDAIFYYSQLEHDPDKQHAVRMELLPYVKARKRELEINGAVESNGVLRVVIGAADTPGDVGGQGA